MTDALSAALQRTLGDTFCVDRELGGGGMSRVFVARDLTLQRDIVVKVLSGEPTAGVNVDRFRREITTAAGLQHPHIVPVFSAGETDGVPYFTMPFVDGNSLRARITGKGVALSIAESAKILREVLQALAYAHEHGFVHRDIKPDNVLLADGVAVVTDFGVAKALSNATDASAHGLTGVGLALGTPAYMAPEQISADPRVDHRADIYAWGCMAYELLTGTTPFGHRLPAKLFAAHLTEVPVPIREVRRDVPEQLAALVERSLAKDPNERPQSAREMIATLASVTTPSPTAGKTSAGSASPQSSLGLSVATPASSAAKRKLWPFLVSGFVSVAIIAAVILNARNSGSTSSGSTVKDGADIIAVMPLSSITDTSLARLG